MDRKSIFAVVLITLVILLLPTYYKLIYNEPEELTQPIQTQTIEKKVETEKTLVEPQRSIETVDVPTIPSPMNVLDTIDSDTDESFFEIESPLYSTKISNRGGGQIKYWYLAQYDTWLEEPVNIVNEYLSNGLNIYFLSVNGERVNFDEIYFHTDYKSSQKIVLNEEDQFQITFYIQVNGSRIKKQLTFFANYYHIDLAISIEKPENILLNNEYQIGWINGLPANEENIVEEYTYSEAYSSMGDELENYTIDDEEEKPETFIGNTDWIAVRTKYFLSAIIPRNAKAEGVSFSGVGVQSEKVLERRYNVFMNVNNAANDEADLYTLFMGPLDHSILKKYEVGLDDIIMSHGWYERTFRAISLPIVSLLKFFHIFIPNYGIVIILFSILVKIVVYPLTKKSYKSMKEMSKVQPLVAELKEKYKKDPQRLNKETMKLYKEHSINPLGGCLPMLLQLPLLGALFIVFRSTIQLRGASFIPGWIDDLSRADTIFTLPISLPLYGDQFNILPILMAGSMIFQSKMTMQDPKQKAMVYLMPIFMLLIFNQFPSGLNLYYTMFNVLTIIQQKFTDGQKKGTDLKK
jgi:YidC/Oxa1 family membrane protein insertase